MPRNPDVAPERCPENVWAFAARIDGWLTREEADLLWRYADSPWCEVGTYRGRSAQVLSARGAGHCVDLFEDWYAVNIISPPLNALFHHGDYADVADEVPEGLRFLYLDADHSFEHTMGAFSEYAHKVRVGGHLALHDALELHPGELDWPDVGEAAFTIMHTDEWKLVAAAHRVIVFRRVK